jgi:hypothetical protein
LQDFVNLAEHLIKSSNELPKTNKVKDSDTINFDADSPNLINNVGIANSRTISSSSTTNTLKKPLTTNRKVSNYRSRSRNGRIKRADNKEKNTEEELADSSLVPLDLSNYSKPSRLDIFLPEYLDDHVESYGYTHNYRTFDVVDQPNIKAIKADIEKAVEAMENLEDPYKALHDQIEAIKKLLRDSEDPARKTLEDILSTASVPSSTLESNAPLTTDSS